MDVAGQEENVVIDLTTDEGAVKQLLLVDDKMMTDS
jgi:hypothetical protein